MVSCCAEKGVGATCFRTRRAPTGNILFLNESNWSSGIIWGCVKWVQIEKGDKIGEDSSFRPHSNQKWWCSHGEQSHPSHPHLEFEADWVRVCWCAVIHVEEKKFLKVSASASVWWSKSSMRQLSPAMMKKEDQAMQRCSDMSPPPPEVNGPVSIINSTRLSSLTRRLLVLTSRSSWRVLGTLTNA